MDVKRLLTAFAGALSAVSAVAWNETTLDWQGTASGAIDDPTRWGLSAGTDISWNDATQYVGRFAGKGNVKLNLTLGADFFFNRLYLQSAGTQYDLDLSGHSLRLYGAATHGISFNQNNANQKLVIRNGMLDYKGCNRQFVDSSGSGILYFAGTLEKPFVITNAASFQPDPGSGGTIVFSNTVFTSGGKIQPSAGRLVLTGPRTSVRQTFEYFGPIGSSSTTFEITDGAQVSSENSHGSQKHALIVGDKGSGNEMIISGPGTLVVCTNSYLNSDGGTAAIVVGKRGNRNSLHITDSATFNSNSKILIGNPGMDTVRGSAHQNFIRIDSNAVVKAADIWLGQMAARTSGGGEGYDSLAYFRSNTCEIADHANVSLSNYGLKVGAEARVDDSSISISTGARVSTRCALVGAAGSSNRIEVVDGGVLYCKESGPDWGVRVGGTASTGAVFVVDGGVLAATNCLLQMNGAAPGETALTRIANGADAIVHLLRTQNTGNRIELDDAALVVRMEGKTPYYEGATTEFAFSGRRAQLDCRCEYSSAYKEPFGLYAGTSLSFDVPAGGYADAPIKAGKGVTIQGLSSCKISMRPFVNAGGESQVLVQAGSGTISIDDTSLAKFQAAAAAADGKIKLTDDQKQIILSVRRGLLLLVR